jgi:hypothetical protein
MSLPLDILVEEYALVSNQEGIRAVWDQHKDGARVQEWQMQDPNPRGHPRALTPQQEERVVECIATSQRMGYAMTQEQIKADLVAPMASLHNVYPFGTTATGEPKLPSDAWLRRFLRRHQDSLRFNRGSLLSYIRAMAATPRAFQLVYDALRGRMDIPETVVMMDECIRHYVRMYPSEQEILQAALSRQPAAQGIRRRGRLENAEMTWMTSDAAKEHAKEKEGGQSRRGAAEGEAQRRDQEIPGEDEAARADCGGGPRARNRGVLS